LIVGVVVLLIAGAIIVVFYLGRGSSTPKSACDLLSRGEARALLDNSPHIHITNAPSQVETTGQSGACLITGFPPFPGSLLVSMEREPNANQAIFSRFIHNYGAAVSIDGQTAWWIPPFQDTDLSRVPRSEDILIAFKSGYEIVVQADPKRSSIERRAMTEILPSV